ncbi:DJ-1/PfpI family protein [Pseudoroseomonas globiformis]|uniref:DJ-1/PfpI family protein n=1 Tax=Teichococcus globiformis TaxID=2307229 RepID=A0ABV7GAH7_9PROT
MSEEAKDRGASRRSVMVGMGLAAPMLASLHGTDARAAVSAGAGLQGDGKTILGMLVFDGFQLLDVFGPLEMFGNLRDQVCIIILGERAGPVVSSAGPAIMVDATLEQAKKLDVFMVPGGAGTRREVGNMRLIEAIKSTALATPHVASICTGAALLAQTGLLDGARATTNKRAFRWVVGQGSNVQWVRQARWVEDGKYFTSSGISAGTDMALAMIERLYGRERAQRVADGAEYHWNNDPANDPFAKLNGLVD